METWKLTTFTLHKPDTLTSLHYRSFVSFWFIKLSSERLEASHLYSNSELVDITKEISNLCHLTYIASLSVCLSKFFTSQKLINYLQYCFKILNITMKINSLTRVLGIQVRFICAGLNASIGAMWTLVGLISRVAHLVTSKRIMISCYILTFITMERFLTCAEEIVNWNYHSADIAKNMKFNIL